MSKTATRGILITTILGLTALLFAMTPLSARGNGDDPENHAPVVDAGADQEASAGDTVLFSGSLSDADAEDTHVVEWDFGDGQSAGPSNCTSHPVISEVFYDEEGTDTKRIRRAIQPNTLRRESAELGAQIVQSGRPAAVGLHLSQLRQYSRTRFLSAGPEQPVGTLLMGLHDRPGRGPARLNAEWSR
jgi:hypothetical protein